MGSGGKRGGAKGKGKGMSKSVGKSGGKANGGGTGTDSGKGVGKQQGRADGMTRKQRQAKGKGKGNVPSKGELKVHKGKADAKSVVRNKLKHSKKNDAKGRVLNNSIGHNLGHNLAKRGVDMGGNDANLSRWERRRQHFKETAKKLKRQKHGADEDVQGGASNKSERKRFRAEMEKAKAVTCKKRHVMEKRSVNPAGYQNAAACDICGLENIAKKKNHFFHCSFCRFDICPKCAEEKMAPKKARKRENDSVPEKQNAPAVERSDFTRARREIWLPTDTTAVNRAPADVTIVSTWVEGMPV